MKLDFPLSLPNAGPMTCDQVRRYRALLAFQLRAAMMEPRDIARVLNFPTEHARRYVKVGRRLMIDCVVQTVPD
jgi:hypothetical protein